MFYVIITTSCCICTGHNSYVKDLITNHITLQLLNNVV